MVDTFACLMAELPRPILFYCRTGTRCTMVWAQASVGRFGVDKVLEIAARAGYDLQVLRDDLVELVEQADERGHLTSSTTANEAFPFDLIAQSSL